jgi:hypothetical protein
MTMITVPTVVRHVATTRLAATVAVVVAMLLLVAAAALVFKSHLPPHSVLHALDSIPAPLRSLFLGSDGSRFVQHSAAHLSR